MCIRHLRILIIATHARAVYMLGAARALSRLQRMFDGASAFNQALTSFDTSSVTDMEVRRRASLASHAVLGLYGWAHRPHTRMRLH